MQMGGGAPMPGGGPGAPMAMRPCPMCAGSGQVTSSAPPTGPIPARPMPSAPVAVNAAPAATAPGPKTAGEIALERAREKHKRMGKTVREIAMEKARGVNPKTGD